jgi:hypothetical protein
MLTKLHAQHSGSSGGSSSSSSGWQNLTLQKLRWQLTGRR